MKWLGTILLVAALAGPAPARMRIVLDPGASPREQYGASKLEEVLALRGFTAPQDAQIIAAVRSSALFGSDPSLSRFAPGESEAFHILRAGNRWLVAGSDPSGVLYGCLELARLARTKQALPVKIDLKDRPAFRIRGTNLFWMKRGKYNWDVTPENFPWFFDRALMTRYLDELAGNRYNTIFFWNGHPFPYFLRLARYPEARVLSHAELARNMEYFRWFTREADRRGLWTVFHFYNIHVSGNFAKAHSKEGVKEENPESTPLLASYMRYCVSEFVNTYPSVGLMLTAGEALNVNAEQYVRDVIIAGLKETGKSPPLIVRQWTIDPDRFRDIILPHYENLFTMMKHNTEMLVSPFPDERNKSWISFGKSHLVNLHELADIKPFRWGSPLWIAQAVQNWQNLGFSGFHLYPMTSWMWPDSLDRTDPLLSVIDRDSIWIEAFGRYGWQPHRPAESEEAFWKGRLSERFGDPAAGAAVYNYYVKTGPVLPGFQNLVNIYNMNHFPTAVSEDATLSAILTSERTGDAGETLARALDEVTLEAFERRNGKLSPEVRGRPPLSVREFLRPHRGAIEPLPLAEVLVRMAEESLAGLESAQGRATREKAEWDRFLSDNRSILYLARFYRAKLASAVAKGKYDASGNLADYDTMLQELTLSVAEYRKLAELASRSYRQGTDLGEWHRWTDAAKNFEDELSFYATQRALGQKGGQLVYLGLAGPMNDASNAFHWLVEDRRRQIDWSSQSYALGEAPFERAKVVIVYDLGSPAFERYADRLRAFVERGGKLLFWDVQPSLATPPFLEGLVFSKDRSREAPAFVAFRDSTSPLLDHLRGKRHDLDPQCGASATVAEASQDWHELAYTVLSSINTEQIQWGFATFGERWTSDLNSVRRPLLLAKKMGAGEIVLAQLGSCSVRPSSALVTGRSEQAPLFLRQLAENLLRWAQGESFGEKAPNLN